MAADPHKKVAALFWYLRHPSYYGELFRLSAQEMKRKMVGRSDDTRQAQAWCKERVIPASKIFIGGKGLKVQQVMKVFPDIFQEAKDWEKRCPVPMGGGASLDVLYSLAEHIQAKTVVETGVAYGWSSLAFLVSLNKREGVLFSIDKPYPGRNNEAFVGCVVPEQLRKGWTLLRGTDRREIPQALRQLEAVDLCHYDSDKSYEGRMWAYPRLWKALRPGGIFVSDDIGDNIAFADFCGQVQVRPSIISSGGRYVGFLVKP